MMSGTGGLPAVFRYSASYCRTSRQWHRVNQPVSQGMAGLLPAVARNRPIEAGGETPVDSDDLATHEGGGL